MKQSLIPSLILLQETKLMKHAQKRCPVQSPETFVEKLYVKQDIKKKGYK